MAFFRWDSDISTLKMQKNSPLPEGFFSGRGGNRHGKYIFYNKLYLLAANKGQRTLILPRCQISSTYSWMVLSEENFPQDAVCRMAFLAQDSSSR